jgi:hypothetical protein
MVSTVIEKSESTPGNNGELGAGGHAIIYKYNVWRQHQGASGSAAGIERGPLSPRWWFLLKSRNIVKSHGTAPTENLSGEHTV